MAAYNAEKYVARAIEDLLQQTMRDFELIIVEDGSRDSTNAIVEGFALQDDRIKVVRNVNNVGLTASLNRGLEICRSPIVARADADDEYMPDRLERQLSFMDENPEVGLLSCAVDKIDEEGNRLFTREFPTEDGEIRMRELFVNCFSHPGVMFRRNLVIEVGGYNSGYSNEDADLWERLRRRTRAANLDVPLVRYRKHSNSAVQLRSAEESEQGISVRQRAIAHYLERPVEWDEAASMVTLFWARKDRPLSPKDYRLGILGLRDVRSSAKRRETKEVVAYFRRQVHDALILHARLSRQDRRLRFALLAEAVRWHPRAASYKIGRKILAIFFGRSPQ